jgi:hypothetical protein
MNKTLLVIFAFIGVFVCGALVGGAAAVRFGRDVVEKRAVAQLNLRQLRTLGETLELTAEQKRKIRPLLQRAVRDRVTAQRHLQLVQERVHDDIALVLTPTQLEKYRQFRANERERDRAWLRWAREQRARRAELTPSPADADTPPAPPAEAK